MPLYAGLLRRKVTVQSLAETTDTFGQKLQSWSDVCALRARIRPVSGAEAVVGKQVRPELSHIITIRNPRSLVTLTPEHRLRFDDPAVNAPRYFGILDVPRFEEGLEFIDLSCKEIVGDPGT